MVLAGYKRATRTWRKRADGLITNEMGGHKKPLIAWRDVTTPTKDGGLGLNTFEMQAEGLEMRYMTKLITEEKKEWVLMAQ